MMRIIKVIFVLCVFSLRLNGQSLDENLIGKVSFISPQNIYVKFKSTDGLSAGDTLFIYSGGKTIPVLIIKNLSSVSCVCTSITSKSLGLSQDILAKKRVNTAKPDIKPDAKKVNAPAAEVVPVDTSKKTSYKNSVKRKVNGSISVYSYSDFSNTPAKRSTQLRYNYMLDARNIGNSRFSIENYITFRQKIGDWSAVKSDIFNALKIYTFAVRFEPAKTTRITLGRTINYKISSIGAMDGLQFEKTFNKFSTGVLAGFRPDYKDYGFNSNLFQYGGYVAFDTKSGEKFRNFPCRYGADEQYEN